MAASHLRLLFFLFKWKSSCCDTLSKFWWLSNNVRHQTTSNWTNSKINWPADYISLANAQTKHNARRRLKYWPLRTNWPHAKPVWIVINNNRQSLLNASVFSLMMSLKTVVLCHRIKLAKGLNLPQLSNVSLVIHLRCSPSVFSKLGLLAGRSYMGQRWWMGCCIENERDPVVSTATWSPSIGGWIFSVRYRHIEVALEYRECEN